MACISPKIRAVIPGDGGRIFASTAAFLDFLAGRRASNLSVKSIKPQEIPCGYCLPCCAQRQQQTAFRISKEIDTALSSTERGSYFLTLTYDPEHLPPGGLLERSHLELLLNSLQQAHSRINKRETPHLPARFKYYGVGEYGTQSMRAHYHVILIGFDLGSKYPITNAGRNAKGNPIYTCAIFDKLWGRGRYELQQATPAAALYVAKYTLKQNQSKIFKTTESKGNEYIVDASSAVYRETYRLLKLDLEAGGYTKASLKTLHNLTTQKLHLAHERAKGVVTPQMSHINSGFVGISKSSRKNPKTRELQTITNHLYTGLPLETPLPMKPEFSMRSPSLGRAWTLKHLNEIYTDERLGTIVERGGQEIQACRYMDKLFAQTYGSDQHAILVARRSTKRKTKSLDQQLSEGRSADEILIAKANIRKARMKSFPKGDL